MYPDNIVRRNFEIRIAMGNIIAIFMKMNSSCPTASKFNNKILPRYFFSTQIYNGNIYYIQHRSFGWFQFALHHSYSIFDGFEIIGRKSIQKGTSSILSCLSDEYLIKRITYLIIKHPLLLII